MNFPSYSKVIKAIERLPLYPRQTPTLDFMNQALDCLMPELEIDSNKVILVAGTNGKGSVCATLEALLLSAGERVGLFTSPHLKETTERFRIQGKDISQSELSQIYQEVYQRTAHFNLTHFEVLTLIATWFFFSKTRRARSQWSIFEVGLGGLWDATNAIPHQICIITSLGYDHQGVLGNSLEEIAANKFGIIQFQSKVIHSPFPNEVKKLAKLKQRQTQSKWIEATPFRFKVDYLSRKTPEFVLQTPWGEVNLNLIGARGAENSTTALIAFQELGFDPQKNLQSITQVRWPGRMEKLEINQAPCPVYLSGDHNVPGVLSLIELLNYFPRNHLYILLGIGKDKDIDGILSLIFSLQKTSVFLTESPYRGKKLSEYGHWLSRAKASYQKPLEALSKIMELSGNDDLILVTGSLYLVGHIKHELPLFVRLNSSHLSNHLDNSTLKE